MTRTEILRYGLLKPHLTRKYDGTWHAYYQHRIGIGRTPSEAYAAATMKGYQRWVNGR